MFLLRKHNDPSSLAINLRRYARVRQWTIKTVDAVIIATLDIFGRVTTEIILAASERMICGSRVPQDILPPWKSQYHRVNTKTWTRFPTDRMDLIQLMAGGSGPGGSLQPCATSSRANIQSIIRRRTNVYMHMLLWTVTWKLICLDFHLITLKKHFSCKLGVLYCEIMFKVGLNY